MMIGNNGMFLGSRAVEINPDIIAYYRFDGDLKDSARANDGVAVGALTYDTGVNDQSLGGFDEGLFCDLGNDGVFSFFDDNGDLPFSFTGFMKFKSINNLSFFISKRRSGGEYGVFYYAPTKQLGINLFSQGQDSIYLTGSATFDPTIDEWYHFAITYDGSATRDGLNTYINGAKPTQTKTTVGAYTGMASSGLSLIVGDGRTAINDYLDGNIDGLGIWNKELSESEVAQIYADQLLSELF